MIYLIKVKPNQETENITRTKFKALIKEIILCQKKGKRIEEGKSNRPKTEWMPLPLSNHDSKFTSEMVCILEDLGKLGSIKNNTMY